MNEMETPRTKIYRITYRARVGSLALVGEINFKTKKEKWDIDHEKIVATFLKQNGGVAEFDSIIDSKELK